MAHFLLINGPNLNLLGSREPAVYGATTLEQIETGLRRRAEAAGHRLESCQHNAEHAIVEAIHAAAEVDCILINPAAFTHTSVAIRDALLAVGVPFIELHLSNPAAREAFRHRSYLSDIAQGVISGFGAHSYTLALDAAIALIADSESA